MTGTRCCTTLELIVEGLGELAEDLTSGFIPCWPAVAFVLEARGDREAADRLLDDIARSRPGASALSANSRRSSSPRSCSATRSRRRAHGSTASTREGRGSTTSAT